MSSTNNGNETTEKAASSTTTSPSSLQAAIEQPVAYSIFTKNQKRGIVLLVAFAAVFSPLSSFIYYPARNALADDMHVSLNRIDLTITSYMVVSGVVATLVGGMADKLGRRPVYLAIITIYIIANVGLAFQSSYPALLVLRMVQSAGSSGR
jgi:MFS family permease